MRIDIDKLEAMGVKFNYSEKERVIDFYAERINEKAQKMLRSLANLLEFSDIESDELLGVVYRIQMISILKKASGG